MKQIIVIYLQHAKARTRSASVKQVESLKNVSVEYKPPG